MNIKNLFINYIKLRDKLNKAKITDNSNQNVYIGSTCKTLKERLSQHKSNYKSYLNGLYHNVTSFDIIKNNDYKIESIENCNIKTKQELFARERYFIENNECINKIIPGRTDKEYKDDNKDKINEKKNLYRDANKDKIKAYRDANNEKHNCECGGKFSFNHKVRHLKTTKHQNYLKSLN